MEGSIDVLQRTGEGRSVRFYLPASEGAAERVHEVDELRARGTETILVAEDHEECREWRGRFLETLGITLYYP